MSELTLFILPDCPHCHKALRLQQELMAEKPELSGVKVNIIDESAEPELANSYDYYYVPTYYLGREKLHEGIVDKETVERILRRGL
jgi:glutaredoxin